MKTQSMIALLFCSFSKLVFAQCNQAWLPVSPGIGAPITPTAMTLWDVDGPGPRGPQIVIAGGATSTGGVQIRKVITWTGQAWEDVGADFLDAVQVLFSTPNGDLYAGGYFTQAAGSPANGLARWTGSAWVPVGGGVTGAGVKAIASASNGDLIVAGSFTHAGGIPALNIARWTGSQWQPLGDGLTRTPASPSVNAVLCLPDGTIYAGGEFNLSGSTSISSCIARWNGTSWLSMGSGMSGVGTQAGTRPVVHTLTQLPNGDIVAGGDFLSAGGITSRNIARWNGTQWISMTSDFISVGQGVLALSVAPTGELIVGGLFSRINNMTVNNVARWTTASGWQALPQDGFNNYVQQLAIDEQGRIVASGGFTGTNAGSPLNYISRSSATAWNALGSGFDNSIWAAVEDVQGRLVVAGDFQSTGETPASYIAQRVDGVWQPLGAGLSGPGYALAAQADGSIIVGGGFFNAGGVPTTRGLARWQGGTWSSVANLGTFGTVNELAINAEGHLFVGGRFTTVNGQPFSGIAKWNGTSWSNLGGGVFAPGATFNPNVLSLLPLSNGAVVVGGQFTEAGGQSALNIALWNGTSWNSMQGGVNDIVRALALAPNGDVLVGGRFRSAGGISAAGIARWNALGWSPVGNNDTSTINLSTIVVEPNGDFIVAGTFTRIGGAVANNIAQWRNSQWSAFEGGIQGVGVYCGLQLQAGTKIFGGVFTSAGNTPSVNLAEFGCTSTCDSIDFNQDSLFPDDQDLIDFLSVLAGGSCSTTTCNDIDFNNDGLFPDDNDLVAFLTVLAGGAC